MRLTAVGAELLAVVLDQVAAANAPRAAGRRAGDLRIRRRHCTARIPFADWPAERVWHVLSGLGDQFSGLLVDAAGRRLAHGRAAGYRLPATSSRDASPRWRGATRCTAATASLPSRPAGDSDRSMCGISVLLDTNGSSRLASRLLAMHSVIRHRGPDGEGFLLLDAQGALTRADTRRTIARSIDPTPSALHSGG